MLTDYILMLVLQRLNCWVMTKLGLGKNSKIQTWEIHFLRLLQKKGLRFKY